MAQNTYGDFIDLVERTEITKAAVFIERWKKPAAEEHKMNGVAGFIIKESRV